MTFKASELVAFCLSMVGMPYWYGACVYICSNSVLNSKTKQYPAHYTPGRTSRYKDDIAKRKVCADCVGLIKGFFWTNGGKGVIEYIRGGAAFTNKYGSNGCPDKSANGMLTWCKSKGGKSGKIATLPDVPGILLFSSGHVGVYIGGGYAVDARGFNYGIVKTKVASRSWTDWAYMPNTLLQYDNPPAADVPEQPYGIHGFIPDVSVYQNKIDMDKFCAGNDFAIFRARVNGKDDTKFAIWAKELKARNFPFAVYDYLRLKSVEDAIAQADAMYAACSPYNPKIYYLDTEQLSDGVDYAAEKEYIKAYVNRLREHGVKLIGQYMGDYRWRTTYRDIESIFDTLWIANWEKNEGVYTGWKLKSAAYTDKIHLHQYTSNGYSKSAGSPGIEHRIDLNRLTGVKPLSWFTGREYIEHDYTKYVVAERDTLWGIAKKLLGAGKKYTKIMELNDMSSTIIHKGDVLKIPTNA